MGIRETENGEEIHVDDQADADDQATVDDPIASQGEGDGLIEVMNSDHIEPDLGLRIPIDDFHPNIRDEVRLAYVAKGTTRPVGHDYPRDHFDRNFCEKWYTKHPWLEYSMEKDAAYCFYCFLFRQDPVDENFGYKPSPKRGIVLGRMHTKHFLFMLAVPGVSTIKQRQHMKISKIRGHV